MSGKGGKTHKILLEASGKSILDLEPSISIKLKLVLLPASLSGFKVHLHAISFSYLH